MVSIPIGRYVLIKIAQLIHSYYVAHGSSVSVSRDVLEICGNGRTKSCGNLSKAHAICQIAIVLLKKPRCNLFNYAADITCLS